MCVIHVLSYILPTYETKPRHVGTVRGTYVAFAPFRSPQSQNKESQIPRSSPRNSQPTARACGTKLFERQVLRVDTDDTEHRRRSMLRPMRRKGHARATRRFWQWSAEAPARVCEIQHGFLQRTVVELDIHEPNVRERPHWVPRTPTELVPVGWLP